MRRLSIPLSFLMCVMVAPPASPLDVRRPDAHYTHASWNSEDGLPGNQIFAIAQDQDGYLWLGTNETLVRFDGVRFVRCDALGYPPLPATGVRSLHIARNGAIWVGLDGSGGVSRLLNGHLTNFTPSDGIPRGAITELLEDSRGAIWAGGPEGLARFDRDRWELVTPVQQRGAAGVFGLFEEPNGGGLLVGLPGEVQRRDPRTGRFEVISKDARVRSFVIDDGGSLWATSLTEAITRMRAGGTLGAAPFVPNWTFPTATPGAVLFYDHRKNLWLGTFGAGLLRLRDGRLMERLTIREGMTNDVVRAVFEDREGNIWAGTQSGLNRLSPSVITTALDDQNPLVNVSRAVIGDGSGGVWIGTVGGLYHLTERGQTRFGRAEGLPGDSVGALFLDGHGTLWIVTDGGVARSDGARFETLPVPTVVQVNRISAIAVDDDAGLWMLNADHHLFRWHNQTLTPISSDKAVRTVGAHRDGSIWIGTLGGEIMVWDHGTTRTYSRSDGLPGGDISAFFQDSHGVVWIGANCLSMFRDGKFLTVDARHGLPDNPIVGIGESSDSLWFLSRVGVTRITFAEIQHAFSDPSYQVHFTVFDHADGLPGDPGVSGHAVARGSGDTMFVVTRNGVAVIDPERADKKPLAPLVKVESAAIDGRVVAVADDIHVPPLRSTLEINYTGLSFAAPLKVRFKYRLNGFDSQWVDAGARRQAFFTNLRPGRYEFQVIAENDGVWNESGAIWRFVVEPRFYQTIWFYLAAATIVAVGAGAAWRIRAHQITRQFSLVVAERTRMAREIHDTLLQSLVGVALDVNDIANTLHESPPQAERELQQLRRRVEMYIRETRQSIWDLRSPILSGRTLEVALRDAVSPMATSHKVKLEVEVTGTPVASSSRTDEQLLRIGQEAVTNAIRHAAPRSIRISLAYQRDSVRLRIADDGRGFDLRDTGNTLEYHWGIVSMQERAQLIGAELRLDSAPGEGTRLEVIAPVRLPAAEGSERETDVTHTHSLH